MKPLFTILILFLLAGNAFGTVVTIGSGDLPYTTAANDDTLRITGTSITCATDGIIVNHDRILIDGQNDTLIFGTGDGSSLNGIAANNGNCTIRNLAILHGGTGADALDVYINNGGDSLLMQGCDCVVYGNNSNCIDAATQACGIQIDTCHFWNYSTSYTSRSSYDGSAIRLQLRQLWQLNDDPNSFAVHMYGDTVHVSPHCGLAVYGNHGSKSTCYWDGGVCYNTEVECSGACDSITTDTAYCRGVNISYCEFLVDAQNTLYDSTNDGTFNNFANAFGMLFRDCKSPFEVHHNHITSGINASGGRGVELENIYGLPSDTAKFYSNNIDVHFGDDTWYNDDNGGSNPFPHWGIRIERDENGKIEYLDIYDNTVKITLKNQDSCVYLGAYSPRGAAIYLSLANSYNAHVNIYRNVGWAAAYDNSGGLIYADGFRVGGVNADVTVKLWDNHWKGAKTIYNNYCEWNNSGDVFYSLRDTFEFDSNICDTATTETFRYGMNAGANLCTLQIIKDGYFVGDATYDDVAFANSGTLEHHVQERDSVRVVGNNGLLVENVPVTSKNAYNQTVINGNTGDSGFVWDYVTILFDQRIGDDSTGFGTFTRTAISGVDTAVFADTIGVNHAGVTCSLTATAGTIDFGNGASNYLLRGVKR